MKRRWKFWGGLVVVGLLIMGMGVMWQSSRPLTSEQAQQLLARQVQALRQSHPQLSQAQLLVASPQLTAGFGTEAQQPFHTASVGKLFTTVLIAELVEQGKLRWDSKLLDLLPNTSLEGLFVVEGVDYQDQVRLEHLLMHTSGVADYFADPSPTAKPLGEQIVQNPNTVWTPQAMLEFSRQHQKAVAAPGAKFHYSDTGYILLGLIVEAHYRQPFEQVVHRRIFEPLGMQHSYYPSRTQPQAPTPPLSPAWVEGTDLSQAPAISVDWAGGGVASTAQDLLRFAKALAEGKLLSKQTLEYLSQPLNRFTGGIWYGRGMMHLRFGDFFPLFSSYPAMVGHMGILGTQVLWDPQTQMVVVISLGATGQMERSVRLLIETLGVVRRVRV